MKQDFVISGARTTSVLERDLQQDAGAIAQTTQESVTLEALPANQESIANEPVAGSGPNKSTWQVFFSTFVTIFLAELGDKTQVSTLLMSAEFHKPWVVFLGAGTALISTTLVGVLVGQWLSTRLAPRTLDVAAGVLLALIALSLLWDVVGA